MPGTFRTPGRRSLISWSLALTSAAAFVAGSSAQQIGRAISQAVVTPDDPLFPQEPAPQEPQEPAPAGGAAGRGGRGAQPPPAPRPFNQVITADAKKDEGLFTVYRVGEQLYYEIPKAELGKDMLWVTQIKRTAFGAGYGGQAVQNRVVRWEQTGNRVFLKAVNYGIVADPASPVAQAVADANNPAIARVFNVAAVSPAGNPVVDVSAMYTSDVPEFSPRSNLGARAMDQSRSYLEKVVSFPQNVNVEVTQTFTAADAPAGAAAGAGRAAGRGMRGPTGTILLFHSMVKLPETPMMPRLFDDRVGYFSASVYDYSRDEHKAEQRTFITRYRLEKKDPSAAISEPVKPIVYWVDPATPRKWVPWIRRGIEDWQPAFEAAGFRNAIVAKEAPSKEEDPDWDPEDVRYSVIRWLPSTTENASGPHIHDPRSGEILEADVQFYHNVMNLATMWYFVQVGALDPAAAKLPLSDDLVGRLLEYVVAHEVGHTLGFQHNMKASSQYTLAQVRDKNWIKDNGHTPTLMDYSRFNYVAQPEDGIPAADLVPKIGPYDKWATMWGYKPIATARTPDEEKKTLDEWAREQDSKPFLRFSTSGASGSDPGEETEAVGDADAVAATTLGLHNLKRVAGMLLDATARPGESYELLTEVYGRVVSQWTLEMNHVTNVIGGFNSQEVYNGQTGTLGTAGVRFAPVPRAKQVEALRFLLANAFQTPTYLVKPELLRRMQPVGVVPRIRTAQNSVMNSLLQPARLDRLVEQAALDGAAAYAPVQFLGDLRRGIWSELATPARAIDTFRRNTQRVYLETVDNRLNANAATSEEARALLKGELRAIDGQIRTVLPAVSDPASRRHLEDARDRIAAILDPHSMRTPPAPPATAAGRGRGASEAYRFDYDRDPFLLPPDGCWPDVVIK